MRVLQLLLLLALGGCAGSPAPEPEDTVAPLPALRASEAATTAPMDLSGDLDAVWPYLASKYDADGDGRITEAEYDRESERFGRLDSDGDGVVSAADFATDPGAEMSRMVGEMRAQIAVARFFQEDEDDETVPLDEVDWSFSVYDADGDEELSAEEFHALAAEREHELAGGGRGVRRVMRSMGGESDPWSTIAAAVDGDGNGRVARAELLAFFRAMDDGDDEWSFAPEPREPTRAAPSSLAGGSSGPAEGTLAPDFTLRPPGGGEAVTLSSFRGEKPVALIFGSYT